MLYQESMPFERELRFTRAYQNNINKHPAIREYECLKEQIVQSFRPLKKPDDILAGRIQDALVGFYPIFGGNDDIDKTAYCIREDRCLELLGKLEADGGYAPDYLQEIRDMISFWQRENTVEKVRRRMTPDMSCYLTGDNYNTEIGACYPLYRIAGIHLDAKKLFRYGLNGLIGLIEEKAQTRPESKDLFDAMAGSLRLLQDVCRLYSEEMDSLIAVSSDEKRIGELRLMKRSLSNIAEKKPATLMEAMQLLTLYMLSSGTREIGRLDDYLGDFYVNDIKNHTITRDFAVRLVVNFFDIIEEEFHRDTRALIGGMGRENEASADEFALVVLDALDRRPFSFQPQVSLRYYKKMDPRLYDRSLDILAKRRTFPLLYNDDVNVCSVMKAMDVSRKTAEQYSFFGCGEYMLSGKSIGTPNVLINLAKILELALNNGTDPVTGKLAGPQTGSCTDTMTYEELLDRFRIQTDFFADLAGSFQELVYDVCGEESAFLLTSILYDDCINRGRAIFDGGIEHLGGTVETYGNITVADSLTAIREVVFEQKKFSVTHLLEILKSDFQNAQPERAALLDAHKFGNDFSEADQTAVWVHELVCNAIRRQNQRTRLDSLLVVVINNNMNISMGRCTGATPDGRKAYEFLSNANGAYNGMDREGITALMKSMTKLDTSIHAGANQNFKFSRELFENREKIKLLLGGFFALGGQQTNISVVSQKDLEDAMLHPENHANLLVRVGGYTARFVELDTKTQREVLSRTAY